MSPIAVGARVKPLTVSRVPTSPTRPDVIPPEPINRSYGMGVELRQLEAFVAVAFYFNYTPTTEKLHLGQPTLSELIKKLERELGTPLFTRTTRRVGLTGAGAELLTRSKVILDDVAAATAAVRRIAEGASGRVRLGITPPVAPV